MQDHAVQKHTISKICIKQEIHTGQVDRQNKLRCKQKRQK